MASRILKITQLTKNHQMVPRMVKAFGAPPNRTKGISERGRSTMKTGNQVQLPSLGPIRPVSIARHHRKCRLGNTRDTATRFSLLKAIRANRDEYDAARVGVPSAPAHDPHDPKRPD